MAATAVRSAKLSLSRNIAGQQLLSGSVPKDLGEKDFAALGRSILDIIHKHTGCNCLSGVIHVVLQDEFVEAVNVELPR